MSLCANARNVKQCLFAFEKKNRAVQYSTVRAAVGCITCSMQLGYQSLGAVCFSTWCRVLHCAMHLSASGRQKERASNQGKTSKKQFRSKTDFCYQRQLLVPTNQPIEKYHDQQQKGPRRKKPTVLPTNTSKPIRAINRLSPTPTT